MKIIYLFKILAEAAQYLGFMVVFFGRALSELARWAVTGGDKQ
jgi:hypothetical protein